MKITILTWLVDGNLFSVPLGTKIIILNIIEGWNHHQIPLVHEGKKGLWLEGRIFTSSHWPREINWGVKWEALWSLRLSCLLGVWSVVCVVGGVCERDELVEFVWMCVVHACKKNEHGRRLNVESRNWSFIEYHWWTSFWIFMKIFVYPKSTIGFVSNLN